MKKLNLNSSRNQIKLQEELISGYYKSLYGDRRDSLRLQKKSKEEKMTKLKTKFKTNRKSRKLKKKVSIIYIKYKMSFFEYFWLFLSFFLFSS